MAKDSRKKHALFYSVYTFLWFAALPFAVFSARLRKGLGQRMARNFPPGPFDVWMQAASVGECKLAEMLIRELLKTREMKILVTTCTKEGRQVLDKELDKNDCSIAYFPFDLPYFIKKALFRAEPKAAVMLETELWPGFMRECKKRDIPLIAANARMSTKSYAHYLRLQKILAPFAPHTAVCISGADARRYRDIFPSSRILNAPNMKLDALAPESPVPFVKNPLGEIFGPRPYLFVLASVREQEERHVQSIVNGLLSRHPSALIAIFPRHMQRIRAWEHFCTEQGIDYLLRSGVEEKVSPGTVILWDGFGELKFAYALARSAYVGGSLVPCGGQNFLEAIEQGVVPCIGPHWSNFAWAGREIVDEGLAREVETAEDMVGCLEAYPASDREQVCQTFKDYLQKRKGGTKSNRDAILHALLRT